MKRMISIIFLSLTLSSCSGESDKESNPPESSQIAKDYLSEILQVMKEHAVTRYDVDWGDLETRVSTLSANAKNIQETYPAITKALELLNTNHSSLYSASGEILAYYSAIKCEFPTVIKNPLIDNIGYISVDKFNSQDEASQVNYATSLQKQIANQDNADLIGWIVDLRNNTGGNMFPMIAGVGPLLGDNIHGFFFDANEETIRWGYENGYAYLGEDIIVTVNTPYILLNPLPKIAVLSSRRLASSGEATLIAFKKKSNVRVFGTDSCGLSTGNKGFTLSDGSMLILTTSIMADSDQQKYGGRVPVDQKESPEEVLAKAIEWLQD
jgi:hypothetical protein